MDLSTQLASADGGLAPLPARRLNIDPAPLIWRQVFIQDRETLLYHTADGRWVQNRSDALMLETFEEAYDYANNKSLKHLQIVMSCGIDSKEFAFPLR